MKSVKSLLLVFIILLLMIGCSSKTQIKSKETLGSIKELLLFLPDEGATWVYKGTGVYHHEMTLEDIIYTDQSYYYKIKGEILSDVKNSNYDDYLTEIRYIISKKGWQQELNQSKLLDSKYKGMYLIKFPIEVGNTWQETVLDFDGNKEIITGEIQDIDFVENDKVITVKYSETNSDYYEIRKIMQGKGILAFEQNIKMNQENTVLEYFLEDLNYRDDPLKSSVKSFLVSYNNAWEDYYNNDTSDILVYIDENSALMSNISSFQKTDNTKILFLDLSLKSISVDENKYEIIVDESFRVKKNGEEYIQNNEIKYTLIKRDENFKIVEIK